MSKDQVVQELFDCAQDDWLALWMIAGDAEALLDTDDADASLEMTIELVKALLERGLRAGASPAEGDCVHFNVWPNQDPAAVAAFIRREWRARGGPPGWGDAPWFAAPSFILRGCS